MIAKNTLRARYHGKVYNIPDIWIAGYRRANNGANWMDAVVAWHNQAKLSEEWAKQNGEEIDTEDEAKPYRSALDGFGKGGFGSSS